MFVNTEVNRMMVKVMGYSLPPVLDSRCYKIHAALGDTIETWNQQCHEEGIDLEVETDECILEFNRALRDNFLEKMKGIK